MSRCADCVFWKGVGDGCFAMQGCAVWDLIYLGSSIPSDLTRGYEDSRCKHYKDKSRRPGKRLRCADCSHWMSTSETAVRSYECEYWDSVEEMIEKIEEIDGGYFGPLKYGAVLGNAEGVVCPYFS